jgi:hypothetical protein
MMKSMRMAMSFPGVGPEPKAGSGPGLAGGIQRRAAGLQAQTPLQAQFGPQVQGAHTHFLFSVCLFI